MITSPPNTCFNQRQMRGLEKVGDCMIPGAGGWPSFSRLGCSARADAVVEHLPASDRGDLLGVFAALGLLPALLVRLVLALLRGGRLLPGPIGNLSRLGCLGLKGTVMTLYYSDPATLARLGYEVSVITDDTTARSPAPQP